MRSNFSSPQIIDLTGKEFTRLTVESFAYSKKGNAFWFCDCQCGKRKIVSAANLKSGNVKSCGCLAIENGKKHADQLHTKNVLERAKASKRKSDGIDGTMASSLTRSLSKRNKSGKKGVVWVDSRKKWQADITIKGKKKFLGRYDNLEDAIKAREQAEKEYFQPILDKHKK
ncbi:hypothetical protein [uncultured Enterococcus sp.]|uniref:hypothetical protein n=1 Tax=uncultured Enterococcus sp. TaxID=167972 RepID=UPI002AA6202C|nr:hypothetical protein [uncultured Enterococcus sp.]